MIYIEVNFSLFCDQFTRMGRADNFTYEGKKTLYRYFEDNGEDYELDVIALCCDWSEYTIEELVKEYGNDHETPEEVLERMRDSGLVLDTEGDTYLLAN